MTFPTTSVLDTFTGTNGDNLPAYSSNWVAAPTGGQDLEIQGNAATGTGSPANNLNNWTTTFGPNSECYVTISTKPGDNELVLLVARLVQETSLATVDGYCLRFQVLAGTDSLTLQRLDNGVQTSLGAAISQEISAGDSIGLNISGSTLQAYYKASGGSWGQVGTDRTDTTYSAAGKLALFSSGTTVRIDGFGGGTVNYTTTGTLTGPGAILSGAATHTAAGHSTSGGLVGQGTTLSGAALRFRQFAASGTLAGSGSSLSGAAAHYTLHTVGGILAGQGSTLSGVARRFRAHATSGALVGASSAISGVAAHTVVGQHLAGGALLGSGAIVAGVSLRYHQLTTSGILIGSGAVVDGAAARIAAPVTHETSGTLISASAELVGICRLQGVQTPQETYSGGYYQEGRAPSQEERRKERQRLGILPPDAATTLAEPSRPVRRVVHKKAFVTAAASTRELQKELADLAEEIIRELPVEDLRLSFPFANVASNAVAVEGQPSLTGIPESDLVYIAATLLLD